MSTISVIVPVYNCEKYLAVAIESILTQTHPPHEILVVDDGSTDRSSEVARKFGTAIRYTRQENAGISAARNTGVSLATGDLLAFLDADDLWTQHKLQIQQDALQREAGAKLIFGLVNQFITPDIDPKVGQRLASPVEVMEGFTAGTMLLSRSLFDRVGSFDESLTVGEFIDWYSRAKELGLQSHLVDEVVLRRRIHGENTGLQQRSDRKDFARILKGSLDRRRAKTNSGKNETESQD